MKRMINLTYSNLIIAINYLMREKGYTRQVADRIARTAFAESNPKGQTADMILTRKLTAEEYNREYGHYPA